MKVTDILTGPEKWSRGNALARDANGNGCKPTANKACAWSLLAAIRMAHADKGVFVQKRAREHVRKQGWPTLCHWEDAPERTFDDVLALVIELGI